MPDHTSNPASQRYRQPNVFNSSTSTPSPSNWKAEQPPHLTSNPISSPPPPRPPPNSPYPIDGSNGRSFRGSVPLPLKHDLNNQTIFPNKSNGPPRIPIERETRPLIVSAVNAVGIGGVSSTNGGCTSRRGRAGGMRGSRGGRERGNTSLGRESLGNGKTEEVGYASPPRTTIHNEQGPSLEETIGPSSAKKRLEMMVEDTTTRPPSSHSLDWSKIECDDGHWEVGGENLTTYEPTTPFVTLRIPSPTASTSTSHTTTRSHRGVARRITDGDVRGTNMARTQLGMIMSHLGQTTKGSKSEARQFSSGSEKVDGAVSTSKVGSTPATLTASATTSHMEMKSAQVSSTPMVVSNSSTSLGSLASRRSLTPRSEDDAKTIVDEHWEGPRSAFIVPTPGGELSTKLTNQKQERALPSEKSNQEPFGRKQMSETELWVNNERRGSDDAMRRSHEEATLQPTLRGHSSNSLSQGRMQRRPSESGTTPNTHNIPPFQSPHYTASPRPTPSAFSGHHYVPPPTPCRCGGMHWKSDCPDLPARHGSHQAPFENRAPKYPCKECSEKHGTAECPHNKETPSTNPARSTLRGDIQTDSVPSLWAPPAIRVGEGSGGGEHGGAREADPPSLGQMTSDDPHSRFHPQEQKDMGTVEVQPATSTVATFRHRIEQDVDQVAQSPEAVSRLSSQSKVEDVHHYRSEENNASSPEVGDTSAADISWTTAPEVSERGPGRVSYLASESVALSSSQSAAQVYVIGKSTESQNLPLQSRSDSPTPRRSASVPLNRIWQANGASSSVLETLEPSPNISRARSHSPQNRDYIEAWDGSKILKAKLGGPNGKTYEERLRSLEDSKNRQKGAGRGDVSPLSTKSLPGTTFEKGLIATPEPQYRLHSPGHVEQGVVENSGPVSLTPSPSPLRPRHRVSGESQHAASTVRTGPSVSPQQSYFPGLPIISPRHDDVASRPAVKSPFSDLNDKCVIELGDDTDEESLSDDVEQFRNELGGVANESVALRGSLQHLEDTFVDEQDLPISSSLTNAWKGVSRDRDIIDVLNDDEVTNPSDLGDANFLDPQSHPHYSPIQPGAEDSSRRQSPPSDTASESFRHHRSSAPSPRTVASTRNPQEQDRERSGLSDETLHQERLGEQIEELQKTLNSLLGHGPRHSHPIPAAQSISTTVASHVRQPSQASSQRSVGQSEYAPLQLGHSLQALLAAKDHLLSQAHAISEAAARNNRQYELEAEVQSLRTQNDQTLVEVSHARLSAQEHCKEAERLTCELEARTREISQLLRVQEEFKESTVITEQKLVEAMQNVQVTEKRAEIAEREVWRLSQLLQAQQSKAELDDHLGHQLESLHEQIHEMRNAHHDQNNRTELGELERSRSENARLHKSIQNLETIDRIQPWLSSYQLIQTLIEEHTAELGSQGSKLATEIKKLQEEITKLGGRTQQEVQNLRDQNAKLREEIERFRGEKPTVTWTMDPTSNGLIETATVAKGTSLDTMAAILPTANASDESRLIECESVLDPS